MLCNGQTIYHFQPCITETRMKRHKHFNTENDKYVKLDRLIQDISTLKYVNKQLQEQYTTLDDFREIFEDVIDMFLSMDLRHAPNTEIVHESFF